jgi:hypothetical protein
MANQILTEKQRIELEKTVGWCGDKIQRVKDLYQVNTVSGWAINRIRITADMAQDRGLPDFFVKNLREIERKMITVAILEDRRPPNLKNTTGALQCPECEQNGESGMNFCANCGRQLWHR